MAFTVVPVQEVEELLGDLEARDPKRHRRVIACLAKLEANPRHPGLNSHPYETLRGPEGQPIWESYVENNAPSAWRVWWYYGPEQGQITVVEVGPHP